MPRTRSMASLPLTLANLSQNSSTNILNLSSDSSEGEFHISAWKSVKRDLLMKKGLLERNIAHERKAHSLNKTFKSYGHWTERKIREVQKSLSDFWKSDKFEAA